MKAEERRKLTWEDATERFLDVAELKPGERPKAWEEACDKMAWNAYNSISGALMPYVLPTNPKCQGWSRPLQRSAPCVSLDSLDSVLPQRLGRGLQQDS